MANFHAGSAVIGVSVHFDLAVSDLSKYCELLERLKEASLGLDLILEGFPAESPHHSNPRYGEVRRERDIRNEVLHLGQLKNVLQRHSEVKERLDDFEESPQGETLEGLTPDGEVTPRPGPLSGTQTHRELVHLFENCSRRQRRY